MIIQLFVDLIWIYSITITSIIYWFHFISFRQKPKKLQSLVGFSQLFHYSFTHWHENIVFRLSNLKPMFLPLKLYNARKHFLLKRISKKKFYTKYKTWNILRRIFSFILSSYTFPIAAIHCLQKYWMYGNFLLTIPLNFILIQVRCFVPFFVAQL